MRSGANLPDESEGFQLKGETEELTSDEVKSFTSEKLDILDAMSCDPELQDIDFRVAFRLIQHVNAKARNAHPSLDRLAAQVGVSRDTVMRSLNRLCDPDGGRHWINRVRADRTQPYYYTFITDRLNMVLDGQIAREDRAREIANEKRRKRFEVAPVQPREVANDTPFEVANGEVFEVAPVQPKHLTGNYLTGTPKDLAHDGEVIDRAVEAKQAPIPSKSPNKGVENRNWTPAENFGEWLDGAPLPVGAYLPTFGRPTPAPQPNTYAAARDVDEINTPFPIPADSAEAERMITDMCQGNEINPTVRRHMLSMLQSGVLTPRMFHNMINPREAGAA